MYKKFCNFAKNEDGAITVEWVVLTAAVIGLSISAYSTVGGGSDSLTGNTITTMTDMDVSDGTVTE